MSGLYQTRLLATLAFAAFAATAASAQSYRAINYLVVVPLNATDFEVIEARGEGARGIWCAAADFAEHALRRDRGGRIYVKTARGPSISGVGRKGVVFTTDPNRLDQPPSTSHSVSVRQVGQGLPIHHAAQFCKDYIIELEDILYRRKGNN